MIEDLAVLTNEKTHVTRNKYFCDNIDTKSISESLNKHFKVGLYVRKSNIERKSHKISLKKIVISKGIISYILNIIKTIDLYNKYLIISLSPYTFIICLLLFIFRKKVFLYLRSNGYEEYRLHSKYFGPIIYHLMFTIVSWKCELISCRKHILRGKKGFVVSPSQLNKKWFTKRKTPDLKKLKLLYVGRIRIEKGVHSLLKILYKLKINYSISIINSEKSYNNKLISKNIKIIHFKNKNDSIIKLYDKHNVFILPSFTEGHPQVLDESLARLRPIIIFPEISHVKRNREGVFITRRNSIFLENKLKYIIKNYKNIQKKMIRNKLPTKVDFINHLKKIIKGV